MATNCYIIPKPCYNRVRSVACGLRLLNGGVKVRWAIRDQNSKPLELREGPRRIPRASRFDIWTNGSNGTDNEKGFTRGVAQ